jgi:hydroxymethylglutaryl-CoA reductase
VNRGGGVIDIRARALQNNEQSLRSTGEFQSPEMVVVDFYINVCEAMGANLVNTVVEGVAPYLEKGL